ncbi:hypothetical protein BUALT_Bualt09G0015000 [Buddleja alternifolia]|uniref:Uncharacterized protein n=1 Tax=Buddleja alternifolia TaxID=168488 RepID=A0AAV6XA00_9LAMI|nr:hypothetical protein BUALT_Bualt09G0015000 [Buddleja alternifolia]
MNPLTLVKRTQDINKKEANLGISEEASWHAIYRDSAYIYVGGIPFDLTEGDLLAVFAQYGDIVDVNLIRDKGTGKSKGFAFLAYEDQRSTILAENNNDFLLLHISSGECVDNLNGAQILGRTVRVDHVSKYKKLEEEDEETKQRKREERGVCRAFQKGECTRGDGCKFSHDEQVSFEESPSLLFLIQRAANTGWGAEEDRQSRRAQDKFEGSVRDGRMGPVSKNEERRVDVTKHKDGHDKWSRDELDGKRSRRYESESYHKYDRKRERDRNVSHTQHRRRRHENE